MVMRLLMVATLLGMPGFVNAAIYSSTGAVSNTGGNTVGTGGTVHTGSASAGAQVTNTVSGSGDSTMHIKTTVNGVTREEVVSDSESVQVQVRATPATTSVEVQKSAPTPVRAKVPTLLYLPSEYDEPSHEAVVVGATSVASVAEVLMPASQNPGFFTRIGIWISSFWGSWF